MSQALIRVYHELQAAKNRPLLGLAEDSGLINKLEMRLQALRAEAAETRTVESEILAKWNARHASEEVPIRYVLPLGMDEYLSGPWIVDEGNGSKRLNP